MFMCVENRKSVNKLDLTWKQSFSYTLLNKNVQVLIENSPKTKTNVVCTFPRQNLTIPADIHF
jgi:hypothetical protein